jgi:hypothetical protein
MFRQSTGHFQVDVCNILELYRSVHTASVYFLLYCKYQLEDDFQRVETCSWFFYKFQFFTVLICFIDQFNVGITVNDGNGVAVTLVLFSLFCITRWEQ